MFVYLGHGAVVGIPIIRFRNMKFIIANIFLLLSMSASGQAQMTSESIRLGELGINDAQTP